jgi:hypothetical protein
MLLVRRTVRVKDFSRRPLAQERAEIRGKADKEPP